MLCLIMGCRCQCMLMRRIARKKGGATDTSGDHEYTDWQQVSQFEESTSRRPA